MLMNFDQILTKSDQILTISVKIHQMHVEKFQGRHFLRQKKLRECKHIAQGLGGGILAELGYIWGGGVGGGN